MNIFDIDNIAFTMGGAGVSWLELISVAAGLGCVVLAGRNSKFNFWVGYLYKHLAFRDVLAEASVFSHAFAANCIRNQRFRTVEVVASEVRRGKRERCRFSESFPFEARALGLGRAIRPWRRINLGFRAQ
jgi:hypothetical protein